MIKRYRKIFSLFLISIIAGLGIHRIVEACADWEPSDDEVHAVYSQDIIGPTPYAPYLFTVYDYYSSPATAADTIITGPNNVSDWQAEIGGAVTAGDIQKLVYGSSDKEIAELQKYVSGKPSSVSEQWKKNSAVQQLKKNNDAETLEYLAFVKQCEPHVTGGYEAWEPIERNSIAMNALIASGQKAMEKFKKRSLRQRYAYQLVRLAHYSEQYDLALKLYNKYFSASPPSSYISWKAYALSGGAHFRKGNKSQSRYIFSRIFDQLPSERELALRNFSWATYEGSMNEGIEFCKSGHEKTTIWFMDAYQREHSEYLPFMESIYREDPNSEYLDVLLARYIALVQRNVLPWRYGDFSLRGSEDYRNYTDAEKFMERCLGEGKLKRAYLWNFGLGYLHYLRNSNQQARIYFNKSKELAKNNQLVQDQVQVMEILLKVQEAPKLDEKFERSLVNDLQWLAAYNGPLKTADARSIIMLQMAEKYKAQANPLRHTLCLSASYGGKNLLYNPNMEPIDELIAFKKKKKKTDFETVLDTSFSYTLSQLNEIRGTLFLSKHQFAEAIKEFEKCESKDIDSLPADPFFIRIRDCHDCDFELAKQTVYTKLSLAKRMLELEKDAAKKPNANTFFMLANGYYNMTYYGNSWMALAYDRWNWRTPWDNYEEPGMSGPAQYFDCTKAMENYVKAMNAAGSNRELAAKACYMASKCEQNAFYNLGKLEDENLLAASYRNYFRELKEKYSDTKYYQEVIRECSYFREYAKRR